jgi:hypothetical protein
MRNLWSSNGFIILPAGDFLRTECEYFFWDSKASGIMLVTFARPWRRLRGRIRKTISQAKTAPDSSEFHEVHRALGWGVCFAALKILVITSSTISSGDVLVNEV